MRRVISYDISDNRIRYRAARLLLGHATRVQKSVFEAPGLGRAGYLRLRSRLERIIDPDTDSLRYYQLCAGCGARVEHFGARPGLLDLPESVEVI